MTTSTTLLGDRRRQALERASAMRRPPARPPQARPLAPPPLEFYLTPAAVARAVSPARALVPCACREPPLHLTSRLATMSTKISEERVRGGGR